MKWFKRTRLVKVVSICLLLAFGSQELGLAKVLDLMDKPSTSDYLLAVVSGYLEGQAINPSQKVYQIFANTYLIPKAAEVIVRDVIHIKNPYLSAAVQAFISAAASQYLDGQIGKGKAKGKLNKKGPLDTGPSKSPTEYQPPKIISVGANTNKILPSGSLDNKVLIKSRLPSRKLQAAALAGTRAAVLAVLLEYTRNWSSGLRYLTMLLAGQAFTGGLEAVLGVKLSDRLPGESFAVDKESFFAGLTKALKDPRFLRRLQTESARVLIEELGKLAGVDDSFLTVVGSAVSTMLARQRNKQLKPQDREASLEALNTEYQALRAQLEEPGALTPEQIGAIADRLEVLEALIQIKLISQKRDQLLQEQLDVAPMPAPVLQARLNACEGMIKAQNNRLREMAMSNQQAFVEGLKVGAVSVALQYWGLRATKSPLHSAMFNLAFSATVKALMVRNKYVFGINWQPGEYSLADATITDATLDRIIQGHKGYSFYANFLGAAITDVRANVYSLGRAKPRPVVREDGTVEFEFDWIEGNDPTFAIRYVEYLRQAREKGILAALTDQFISACHYEAVNNYIDVLDRKIDQPYVKTYRSPSDKEMKKLENAARAQGDRLREYIEQRIQKVREDIDDINLEMIRCGAREGIYKPELIEKLQAAQAELASLQTQKQGIGVARAFKGRDNIIRQNAFTPLPFVSNEARPAENLLVLARAELNSLPQGEQRQLTERLVGSLENYIKAVKAQRTAANFPGGAFWQVLVASYNKDDLRLNTGSPYIQALVEKQGRQRVQKTVDEKFKQEEAKIRRDVEEKVKKKIEEIAAQAELEEITPGPALPIEPSSAADISEVYNATRENYIERERARLYQEAEAEVAREELTRVDIYRNLTGISPVYYSGWQKRPVIAEPLTIMASSNPMGSTTAAVPDNTGFSSSPKTPTPNAQLPISLPPKPEPNPDFRWHQSPIDSSGNTISPYRTIRFNNGRVFREDEELITDPWTQDGVRYGHFGPAVVFFDPKDQCWRAVYEPNSAYDPLIKKSFGSYRACAREVVRKLAAGQDLAAATEAKIISFAQHNPWLIEEEMKRARVSGRKADSIRQRLGIGHLPREERPNLREYGLDSATGKVYRREGNNWVYERDVTPGEVRNYEIYGDAQKAVGQVNTRTGQAKLKYEPLQSAGARSAPSGLPQVTAPAAQPVNRGVQPQESSKVGSPATTLSPTPSPRPAPAVAVAATTPAPAETVNPEQAAPTPAQPTAPAVPAAPEAGATVQVNPNELMMQEDRFGTQGLPGASLDAPIPAIKPTKEKPTPSQSTQQPYEPYTDVLKHFNYSSQAYAAEIQRKEKLGLPLDNPQVAADFKRNYPELFAPAPAAEVQTPLPPGRPAGPTQDHGGFTPTMESSTLGPQPMPVTPAEPAANNVTLPGRAAAIANVLMQAAMGVNAPERLRPPYSPLPSDARYFGTFSDGAAMVAYQGKLWHADRVQVNGEWHTDWAKAYPKRALESPRGILLSPGVTSHFGPRIHPVTGRRSDHAGVDVNCPDAEIRALAFGTVVGIGHTAGEGGEIQVRYVNPNGETWTTRDCHIRTDNLPAGISAGATVYPGQTIAHAATSRGSASGSLWDGLHRHLELKTGDGRKVNPEEHIERVRNW